jgi:hypothetical protein
MAKRLLSTRLLELAVSAAVSGSAAAAGVAGGVLPVSDRDGAATKGEERTANPRVKNGPSERTSDEVSSERTYKRMGSIDATVRTGGDTVIEGEERAANPRLKNGASKRTSDEVVGKDRQ